MKVFFGELIALNGRGEFKKRVRELVVTRTNRIQLLEPDAKIL